MKAEYQTQADMLDAIEATRGEGSLDDRADALGLKPWRIYNSDKLHDNGCPELVAAVREGEFPLSDLDYISNNMTHDDQRALVERARKMGRPLSVAREGFGEPDYESEGSDGSTGCGLSDRALRELPLYWMDSDCELVEGLNLRLLGHPDRDVRVPLPTQLPASAYAQPDRQTLWLLLYCLQQGRDIAGFQLSWWSGEMDHIDPSDRRLTLANIQLISPLLNGSKSRLTQPEFADKLMGMGIVDEVQRDEIVRQHECRLRDPIGFLRWQLEQARGSLVDSDSGVSKHHTTPESASAQQS